MIRISETEVRVKNWPSTMCYQYKTGLLALNEAIGWMDFSKTAFSVSYTKNRYFGLGCYALAGILEANLNFTTSCSTICKTSANIIDGSCSGSGCCQTLLPKGVKKFLVMVDSMNTTSDSLSFDPCSYSFVGESKEYTFSASDLNGTSFHGKAKDILVVLDWAIGIKHVKKPKKIRLVSRARKIVFVITQTRCQDIFVLATEVFKGILISVQDANV